MTDATHAPDTATIGVLRRAGGWFLAASLLWWIAAAALIPADDYFYAETAREEALSIADNAGLFRGFHVVATIGVAAGAVGVVTLARGLRRRDPSKALDAAAAVAVVGVAAWIVEVVIRWTARVADARDVAAGTATPAEEPAVGSWLVFALAAVGFLVPMVCAWVLARRRLPGRRSSLAVAVVATLASLAALGTMAPSLIYQFGLLPLGLTLVLAERRSGAPVPQTSESWAS